MAAGMAYPFSAYATHVMGADISWKSLGNDSFEIIVHGYRDCNGIPLTGTNLTYFTSGDTCAPSPVSANPSVCCGTDITPVCARTCDRCISNSSCVFPYGIEEFTIIATVYLPPSCCNWTIAWEECCRSGAITTGAAGDDFYIEAKLNGCVKPFVSSPYFTAPPVAMFCVNQCVIYNPGVEDDDRDSLGRADSLVYSFVSPQSSAGTDIGYSSPYSFDAPVIYAGKSKNDSFVQPYCYGFHIDLSNGDIKFKATKQDVSVMAFAVDFYRRDSNGVQRKIGEIKRDLQIIAINCPTNHPPVLLGINNVINNYSIKICAGHQTCFSVKAFDLDTADTAKLVWNNPGSMNGATFALSSGKAKWPTAVFCWSPPIKAARSYPYNFVATTTDNECPIPGRVSRAFSIYVGAPASANYSATVQKCGLVSFQASASSTSLTPIASYLWTGDSSPGSKPLYISGKTGTYQYTSPGTYHYKLAVTGTGGCTVVYDDSVVIPKIPFLKLPADTTVCGNTVLRVSVAISNYTKPYSIIWNTGATGDTIRPKIVKDTVLIAGIKDASGCTVYDTLTIKTLQTPKPVLIDDTICQGASIQIGTTPINGLKYTWTSNPSGFSSSISNPTITPSNTTTYILLETLALNGCSAVDSVKITVNPHPISPAWNPKSVCLGSVTTIGVPSMNALKYAWTSNPAGFSSSFASPSVKPATNTVYYVTATNPGNCSAKDSISVIISPLPNSRWSAINKCDSMFLFPDITTYNSYLWLFGNGDSSKFVHPIYVYKSNGNYTIKLTTTTGNGCMSEHDSSIDITCLSNIEETEVQSFLLSLYPNPFIASTSIEYRLNKPSRVMISLNDITGRQIGVVADDYQTSGNYHFNISSEKYHLTPGIYLLKFMTEDGLVSRRIVKL